MNHTLCVFVRIEAILTNIQNVCFPKELHGTVNEKNTKSTDFYADQIDVITNFAVIRNAVIKRFHCTCISFSFHSASL